MISELNGSVVEVTMIRLSCRACDLDAVQDGFKTLNFIQAWEKPNFFSGNLCSHSVRSFRIGSGYLFLTPATWLKDIKPLRSITTKYPSAHESIKKAHLAPSTARLLHRKRWWLRAVQWETEENSITHVSH